MPSFLDPFENQSTIGVLDSLLLLLLLLLPVLPSRSDLIPSSNLPSILHCTSPRSSTIR
ncbi:hypothetical protein DsansV1_C22g0170591 [Dioscorea sansibarensis]